MPFWTQEAIRNVVQCASYACIKNKQICWVQFGKSILLFSAGSKSLARWHLNFASLSGSKSLMPVCRSPRHLNYLPGEVALFIRHPTTIHPTTITTAIYGVCFYPWLRNFVERQSCFYQQHSFLNACQFCGNDWWYFKKYISITFLKLVFDAYKFRRFLE